MAISIIDSFEYKGKKFLDSRQYCETLEELYATDTTSIPEGFEKFCNEDKKWHIFTNNDWPVREGGSGDSINSLIGEYDEEDGILTLKTSNEILDMIYPIGSIYIGIGENKPAFGEWEKIKSGLTLWSDDVGDGREIQAGLPNITGSAYNTNANAFGAYFNKRTGVFVSAKNHSTQDMYYGGVSAIKTADGAFELKLDASKSNAIYGASNTVQPPAIAVSMWQRIK